MSFIGRFLGQSDSTVRTRLGANSVIADLMPYRLKNVSATYQKLVKTVFEGLTGTKVEAYIDDMVVKTAVSQNHLQDLQDVFDRLLHYKMRLNPFKCLFRLTSGKFLGHLMTTRRIKANQDQLNAIIDMPAQRNKEIQCLTEHLKALGRFISQCSDKYHPFSKH